MDNDRLELTEDNKIRIIIDGERKCEYHCPNLAASMFEFLKVVRDTERYQKDSLSSFIKEVNKNKATKKDIFPVDS